MYNVEDSIFITIANLFGSFLENVEFFIRVIINPYILILFLFMLGALTYWLMVKPAKTLIGTGGSR